MKEEVNIHIHNHCTICNKNCDAKIHEEKGFSSILFSLFSTEEINYEINDLIKKYINILSTII